MSETVARTRKALALVDVLRSAGVTSSRDLGANVRRAAASVAHVHPPSDETWAMVAAILDHRATLSTQPPGA